MTISGISTRSALGLFAVLVVSAGSAAFADEPPDDPSAPLEEPEPVRSGPIVGAEARAGVGTAIGFGTRLGGDVVLGGETKHFRGLAVAGVDYTLGEAVYLSFGLQLDWLPWPELAVMPYVGLEGGARVVITRPNVSTFDPGRLPPYPYFGVNLGVEGLRTPAVAFRVFLALGIEVFPVDQTATPFWGPYAEIGVMILLGPGGTAN